LAIHYISLSCLSVSQLAARVFKNQINESRIEAMQKNTQQISLTDLQPGNKVRIVTWNCRANDCQDDYCKSLLAMGLVPGAEFEVLRRAPFGDPIHIRLNDFELSLRQHEVGSLFVLQLQNG
jgi:ferrous iron transport protein A